MSACEKGKRCPAQLRHQTQQGAMGGMGGDSKAWKYSVGVAGCGTRPVHSPFLLSFEEWTGPAAYLGQASPGLAIYGSSCLRAAYCSALDGNANRRREKGGRWEIALDLLNECKCWSTPNTVSYNATMSACEKGKLQLRLIH